MWMLCLICISGLVGCTVSSTAVVTDYDRDASFNDYQTFYWSDDFYMEQNGNGGEDEPLFYNTLIKKRLKKAIKSELEGRGYRLDESNPDLLVDSRVVVQQKNINRGVNYPYYPYYYGWYNSAGSTEQRKEGGVVVELIDKDRRQLVWQGFAPDVLREQTKDKQEEIREAISKIFAKYEYRAEGTQQVSSKYEE